MDNEQVMNINRINKARYYIALAKESFQCLIYGLILGVLLLACALSFSRKQEIFSFFASAQRAVSNLETSSNKIPNIIDSIEFTALRSKAFSTVVLTDDNNRELANYINILNYNSQVVQNELLSTIRESKETSIMFRKQAEPILISANQFIDQGNKVLQTVDKQIDLNGSELKQTIASVTKAVDHVDQYLVDTEPEVIALLQKINQTTENIRIITNDQSIIDSLRNINSNLANLAIVTDAFGKFSHDFVYGTKPKNKFDKYLYRPLKYSIRLLTGSANLLVFIDKLQ